MLTEENINDILDNARANGEPATEQELAVLALCDAFSDKYLAYSIVFGDATRKEADAFFKGKRCAVLKKAAKPFGVGKEKTAIITREENQEELTKMIKDIEREMASENIEPAQGLKMIYDIRFKLQDKFDMDQEDNTSKHIIVVPQKHDIICPHTNRECYSWPSKEACMEHYSLRPSGVE